MGSCLSSKEATKIVPERQEKAVNNNTEATFKASTTKVFWCIQTQSQVGWGLLHKLNACIQKLKLETVDHRTWHRDRIVVDEMFCKDLQLSAAAKQGGIWALERRMIAIQTAIEETVAQPDTCKVSVVRWEPTMNCHSRRRIRLKTQSTPKTRSTPMGRGLFEETDTLGGCPGAAAKLVVDGEAYDIRVSDNDLSALRTGNALVVRPDTSRVVSHLGGYVRRAPK